MKYKLKDATKEELLDFIYSHYGANKMIEDIEIWLNNKRSSEALNKLDKLNEISDELFKAYVNYMKKADDTKDNLDKKIEYMEKAEACYKAYKRANKEYDRLCKLVDTIYD